MKPSEVDALPQNGGFKMVKGEDGITRPIHNVCYALYCRKEDYFIVYDSQGRAWYTGVGPDSQVYKTRHDYKFDLNSIYS